MITSGWTVADGVATCENHCRVCKQPWSVQITEFAYHAWQEGVYIQNAAADQRRVRDVLRPHVQGGVA